MTETPDAPEEFETKVVRVLRGMENRTIAQWEKEGWEFVSRSPGKLQSELHFRRPKSKSRALLYGIAGASVAVVLAIVIGIGVATEGDDPETTPTVGASTVTTDVPTGDESQAETTPAESEDLEEPQESEASVITPENTPELNRILDLTDYCDSSIADFATEFEGRTVSLDAGIGAMNLHGGTSTRYDILLNAGDFSETSAPGPMFQFRDVNTTNDLNFTGDVPDSIGVGTNLRVTAEIVEYEPSTCLLLLEPVETVVR